MHYLDITCAELRFCLKPMTTHLMAIGFSPQVRAWITHQDRNHPKGRIIHRPLGRRIHLRGKQSCKAPSYLISEM